MTYRVGFWSRVDAPPCTFYLGAAGAASSNPMLGDSVSLTISDAEADWIYHEMTWTPGSTITSDGLYSSSGVKLHYTYAANSSLGVAFDDGTVCQVG